MLTKFLTYTINPVIWTIRELKKEINIRDIKGITNDNRTLINIKNTHPFVQIYDNAINNDGNVDFPGILPAMSVTEGRGNKQISRIGDGQNYGSINQSFIDNIKSNYKTEEERLMSGIISNKQISIIENALRSKQRGLLIEMSEFYRNEKLHFSVWTTNKDEYNLYFTLLKGIVEDIRKTLKLSPYNLNVDEADCDPDLVNYDFAKTLYGAEISMDIMNRYSNITVIDKQPYEIDPDKITVEFDGIYKSIGE